MTMTTKFTLSIGSTVVSAALVGMLAPTASAFNFTPNATGEIEVGLGCITECLDVSNLFSSIESLDDTSTGEGNFSRLFVDYFGAGDTEANFGDEVVFKTRDAGTNSDGYWFRPSEYNADGTAEERGQLEVGTYRFNFAQTMANLSIDFFDTESKDTTGVLAINGANVDPVYLAQQGDGNIQTLTFENVDSIVLKLGHDRSSGTGDGVNFRMAGTPVETPVETPEPMTLLGLLTVAGGGLALRKRTQAATV